MHTLRITKRERKRYSKNALLLQMDANGDGNMLERVLKDAFPNANIKIKKDEDGVTVFVKNLEKLCKSSLDEIESNDIFIIDFMYDCKTLIMHLGGCE